MKTSTDSLLLVLVVAAGLLVAACSGRHDDGDVIAYTDVADAVEVADAAEVADVPEVADVVDAADAAEAAEEADAEDVEVAPCPDGQPLNGCGGCAALDEDVGAPGTLCTMADGGDGVSTCDGVDAVACRPLPQNGCGGTAELAGAAGTTCGACGRGVWTCTGPDAVACDGADDGKNTCGGCNRIEAEPGVPCGSCGGVWTCQGDEAVACVGDSLNSCGGCAELSDGEPGETCQGNGFVTCLGKEATTCAPPGGNLCGGSATLPGDPGRSCGPCEDGKYVCASPEAVVCVQASSLNACGGCGYLPGAPGTACAPVGVWTCDGVALTCVFEGGNGCGGTEPLTYPDDPAVPAVLGAPCGVCDAGHLACAGFDRVACVDGDEARSYAWPDGDEDGYGAASAAPVVQCELGEGFVRDGTDCDDGAPAIHPGPDALEVCDGVDDDCDGKTDEGTAGEACSADDGCGGVLVCDGVAGLRCDAIALSPEVCDGLDNDCDGAIDEPDATDCERFYVDDDGDGYGVVEACLCPADAAGLAPTGGDCDDARADISPAAFELCNGLDDDCDGGTDTAAVDAGLWYPDVDADTFGAIVAATVACTAPFGYVTGHDDCDDADPWIHPSTDEHPVAEICDGLDNDCDGATDPDVSLGVHAFRRDLDQDTFGGGAFFVVQCTAPMGYVPSVDAVGVAAGANHVAVLGAIGELVAWGAPNGSDDDVLRTGRVGGRTAAGSQAVAAGDGFTVLLRTDGTLVSFGLEVPPDAANLVAIAAGAHHVLALRADGTVLAFGANDQGQTDVPEGLDGVVAVAAGGGHSLALRDDGTAVAFGSNADGQTDVPEGLADVVGIAAGGRHSVALRSDGTVVAWGATDAGQSTVPDGLDDGLQVAAGSDHTVVLRADGTLTVFGEPSAVPAGFTDAAAVAAGAGFSVVVRTDGTVWVFGRDDEALAHTPTPLRRDCDEANDAIHPDADDVCDFVDNDCDRAVDMDDSQGTTPWYADVDADGHADPWNVVLGCAPAVFSAAPFGRLRAPIDDCNDGNPEAWPGAPEIVADGIDQDCDTLEWCYLDGDGDGAVQSFLTWAVSGPYDLQCTGTSTLLVARKDGVVTTTPIDETPVTLGDAGYTDCADDNPAIQYNGCHAYCIPACYVRSCGDDWCGGSCGTCPDGEGCTDLGVCVPL